MKRTTNNPKPRAGARCPLCGTNATRESAVGHVGTRDGSAFCFACNRPCTVEHWRDPPASPVVQPGAERNPAAIALRQEARRIYNAVAAGRESVMVDALTLVNLLRGIADRLEGQPTTPRRVEVERPSLSFEGVLYHVEREGARRWVAWVDDDAIESHRLPPSFFRGVEFTAETRKAAVDDLCDTIRAAINERDALFASAIANTTGDQGPRT